MTTQAACWSLNSWCAGNGGRPQLIPEPPPPVPLNYEPMICTFGNGMTIDPASVRQCCEESATGRRKFMFYATCPTPGWAFVPQMVIDQFSCEGDGTGTCCKGPETVYWQPKLPSQPHHCFEGDTPILNAPTPLDCKDQQQVCCFEPNLDAYAGGPITAPTSYFETTYGQCEAAGNRVAAGYDNIVPGFDCSELDLGCCKNNDNQVIPAAKTRKQCGNDNFSLVSANECLESSSACCKPGGSGQLHEWILVSECLAANRVTISGTRPECEANNPDGGPQQTDDSLVPQ